MYPFDDLTVSGQEFLAKKLAELEARIERISFAPTAAADVPQEEPRRSENNPVKVLQRVPEVHTIHIGGGGRYAGPFAVSRTSYDGSEYTYTMKTGKVSAHILAASMQFYTTSIDVSGESSPRLTEDGTVYLAIAMDVSPLIMTDAVVLSASVLWPPISFPDNLKTCRLPIAEISAGVVYQRRYGDIDIFFPGGVGMSVCEDGDEKCILNFGQDIECSAMGLTTA